MLPATSRVPLLVALVAVAGASAGCGRSRRDVADPLSQGINGSHVVIDRVSCQPTRDMCERVVVLAPTATQQASLMRAVEARLAGELGWRPTSSHEVVEPDEGDVFDGRSSAHGGTVDPGHAQLEYWQRTGWAQEVPPDHNEAAIFRATQATPSAVVVTIK